MLIPPSLQAPPAPDAPPAWWREKGVPGLELVGEASFARFGTPYVAESFHADAATLRRQIGRAHV